MGKGSNVPSSVGYFGHATSGSKPKNVPDGVSRGPDTVETYNRTSPPNTTAAKGAAHSVVPAGVVRGDGTETRKGITVKHLSAARSGPSTKGDTGAVPGGVRKHSGLSAPKRVK
jgi:hypothetical protein